MRLRCSRLCRRDAEPGRDRLAGRGRGVLPETSGSEDPALADAALNRLSALAAGGNPTALEVLRTSAGFLARTAKTLVNLVDTEILVLGGPTWTLLAPYWLDEVSNLVREGLVRGDLGALTVAGTALGEDVGAIGAASLVLDHAFTPRPTAFVLN